MRTLLSILNASVLFFGASRSSAAVVYWNCSTADSTSILGSDATGITSAAFTDPAVNQSTTVGLISSSSSSSGYTGASGLSNFAADAKIGSWSSSSTYFLITLTPAAGYAIRLDSFSLGTRSTSTGPTAISFYSSIDNYASAIGSVTVSANSTWALSSASFGGNSLTGSTDSAVAVRIYGSGGSGTQPTTANWRIDDISLSVTPVPEPMTWALIVFATVFGAMHVGRLYRRHVATR